MADHACVEDRHRSREFIGFLKKKLDAADRSRLSDVGPLAAGLKDARMHMIPSARASFRRSLPLAGASPDMPNGGPAQDPAMLSRRGFVVRALSGWLGGRAPFFAASLSGSAVCATLCSEWRCPRTIARACLDVLPATETSKEELTRLVLENMQAVRTGRAPVRALAYAIRERSRNDFREGRIAIVDGWILSLTETRVYALSALL